MIKDMLKQNSGCQLRSRIWCPRWVANPTHKIGNVCEINFCCCHTFFYGMFQGYRDMFGRQCTDFKHSDVIKI
ncbi:unnamed protein product [Acanthoscelides obtectus]|uniref:Uncharacterized protein n=1 Tax=Acanthoscelides obtectus TaxID=200917 RepID=A0A9P0KE30_ACAOB|nr:unnamed protein product [Acanthoscelides obtectus]CAK1664218.1 hypothetical protein AOBTE_LOCUS24133 [Acanthoscelides obtectus]